MSELRTEDFLCKFAEIFLSRSLAVITFNSKEWEGEKKEKKKSELHNGTKQNGSKI